MLLSEREFVKGYMTNVQNEPTYYWASAIPGLVAATSSAPSLSTFYRRVNAGAIKKVNVEGLEEAYDGDDVRKFLKGEMTQKKRNNAGEKKELLNASIVSAIPKLPYSRPEPIIDYVHDRSDLAFVFLFLMEALERGEDTLLPQVALSWIERNGWAYWFLSNPTSKEDIWASLGLLPLKNELIEQLLKGQVLLRDIRISDILTYTDGEAYSCYLAVIVKQDHIDALVQLFQKLLPFLCEAPVYIDKMYHAVNYGLDLSPSHLLVKEFFFSPLYALSDQAWLLDLGYANPAVHVQQLQNYLKKRKEVRPMPTAVLVPNGVEHIERGHRLRTESSNIRGYGRYRPILHNGVSVLQLTPDKIFRTASSDDDIKAILAINASHFGRSSRPVEDLIATRRAWIEKNPEVFHVLEVSSKLLIEKGIYSTEELEGFDKKIVGFVSMLPLTEETIKKLVRGELVISQVKGEDILAYEAGVPVSLFVQTLAVDKTIYNRSEEMFASLGRDLSKGLMGMFSAYGEQGIEIRYIHARSDTPFGKSASIGFSFAKVASPPGVEKDVFLLDVWRSELPFLKDYVTAVEQYKKSQMHHQ